jgi:hypothetical protein
VAVGESDTIDVGRLAIVTRPLAACTVTGNDSVRVAEPVDELDVAAALPAGSAAPELAQAAVNDTNATATVTTGARRHRFRNMVILHRFAEDEVRPPRHHGGIGTNRPSSEDSVVDAFQASGLAPRGSSTVAGQRRILTGLRWHAPSQG